MVFWPNPVETKTYHAVRAVKGTVSREFLNVFGFEN
jgi:hypothetical protein